LVAHEFDIKFGTGTGGDNSLTYLELPINLQYGLDMNGFYPYAMFGPYFTYNMGFGNGKNQVLTKEHTKRVDYGLGLGAGVDVWQLQFAFRYAFGLRDLSTEDLRGNPSFAIESLKSRKLSFSVAYKF
jgi:opacity protein-like surface antigen